MNITRLILLPATSAAAFLFASCAGAEGLPSRGEALKLMNPETPFDYFHTIYVCDTSSLGLGVQKTSVDWHFSKGKDAAFLKHCRGGDVSSLGKNSNLSEDSFGVFSSPDGLAEMQRHLGPIAATKSFDGYGHRFIYGSAAPLELGKASNGFATVEPAEAPFVKLTLKTFRYKVGAIEGIREPIQFSLEHECSAVVDYTFEAVDPSPWADAFMDQNPRLWRNTRSACLVRYDDGWRLKKWSIED